MPAKLTHVQYLEKVKQVHSSNLTVCGIYENMGSKISHKCNACGHIWRGRPRDIVYSESGCPTCAINNLGHNRRTTTACYKKQLKAVRSTLRPLEEYVNSRTKILHKCSVCKVERLYKPNNLLNGNGCFICAKDNPYRKETIKIGTKSIQVQGYEGVALNYLLNTRQIALSNIAVSVKEGKPHVPYKFQGIERLYLPDFFYIPKNRIIEVKSRYTLGLMGLKCWNQVVAKAKACIRQGFAFELLVFSEEGSLLKLPSNWYDLPMRKIRKLCV